MPSRALRPTADSWFPQPPMRAFRISCCGGEHWVRTNRRLPLVAHRSTAAAWPEGVALCVCHWLGGKQTTRRRRFHSAATTIVAHHHHPTSQAAVTVALGGASHGDVSARVVQNSLVVCSSLPG